MKRELFVLAICGMMALSTAASATTITLGFDSLPSAQGFTFNGWIVRSDWAGENQSFSVDGEMLHQDTTGIGAPDGIVGGNYWMPSNLSSSSTFSLSVRARVTDFQAYRTAFDFGFGFWVQNGDKSAAFSITPTAVSRLNNSNLPVQVSISDNASFHDYIMDGSFANGTWSLSRDGVSLGTWNYTLASSDRVIFGDSASYSNAAGDISSFSYTYSSVPEPSSILALLCGMGGFGGMIWKRRSA